MLSKACASSHSHIQLWCLHILSRVQDFEDWVSNPIPYITKLQVPFRILVQTPGKSQSYSDQFGPQDSESVQKFHSDLSRAILVPIITNINQLHLSVLVSELLQALLSKINKLLL